MDDMVRLNFIGFACWNWPVKPIFFPLSIIPYTRINNAWAGEMAYYIDNPKVHNRKTFDTQVAEWIFKFRPNPDRVLHDFIILHWYKHITRRILWKVLL